VTKAPRVYVSLNRRGEIAMNAEAFKRIGQPASVTLLYDANRRTIGVKYPVAMDRHFFPARGYGRGRRMRIVRAARLLKQFGIEVERTLVFADVGTATFDEARMLVLDLDNARELGNRTSEQ
jgi:hypothetical protein